MKVAGSTYSKFTYSLDKIVPLCTILIRCSVLPLSTTVLVPSYISPYTVATSISFRYTFALLNLF